ncbi:MAG: glutamate 5-kinase [Lentisphaerae bacterium]|nr:glutamate 5-kinase [Lentisphaerota bacterium]
MKKSLKYREVIGDVRRVVVKIGSRALVQRTGRPDVRRMRALIGEIATLQKAGKEVVLVSSGAIGAGMESLGMTKRPTELPELQMAAAVGQTRLMSRYEDLFGQQGCKVGQMLLTHDNFLHKVTLTNARRTMDALIRNGVIPIINENDVVANEEIRAVATFGDNDFLASLVVKLIRADLLVLLSTVDGVRDTGPTGRSHRVRYLETINRATFKLVREQESHLSKGGMATKLKAAQSAANAGCATIIANGRQANVLTRIMNGEDVGTIILAAGL